MNNKIDASMIIVVRNQESLIENAIRSGKKLGNDIVVIHDRKCTDKTTQIAIQLGARVYVREFKGHSEAHRILPIKIVCIIG